MKRLLLFSIACAFLLIVGCKATQHQIESSMETTTSSNAVTLYSKTTLTEKALQSSQSTPEIIETAAFKEIQTSASVSETTIQPLNIPEITTVPISITSTEPFDKKLPAYGKVNLEHPEATVVALDNHQLLYSTYSQDNRLTNYYVHDFVKDTDSFIGSLDDIYSGTANIAILNHCVYFYVVLWDDSSELICIDLNKNSLRIVEKHNYQYFSYVSTLGDNMLLLKKDLDKLQGKSIYCLDLYNPNSNEFNNILLKELSVKDYGSHIDLITAGEPYQKEFYTLETQYCREEIFKKGNRDPLEYPSENNENYQINKYNNNGDLIETFDANCLSEFAKSGSISQIQYLGNDYIYIKNFSSEGLICKIKDGFLNFAGTQEEKNAGLILTFGVLQPNQSKYVFFKREDELSIQTFDIKTGELKTIPIEYEGCSSVICVYTDTENNLLLILNTEDEKRIMIYTDLDRLVKIS